MHPSWKNAVARAALFCASFVTTSLLMLSVGAAFHGASSQPWLRDSPQARDAVARCMANVDRSARHACIGTLVAAARARDAGLGPARLAALRLSGADAAATAR